MNFPRASLSLALLTLWLSTSLDAAVTAETRDRVYTQAENDRAAGNFEAAAAGYLEVARFEPRNGHTWVRRAVCLNSLKKYQESMLDECRAHAALVAERQDKIARAIALTNRADCALLSGDFAGAFADGLAATKVDETYARAYQVLADAWYAVGALGQAQAYFAKAKERDASLVRSFDATTAARNARNAIAPDDKFDTTADFDAAVAAAKDKKYVEAIALYDRVLSRRPVNDAAWGNRGNALRSLERYAEAVISQSRACAVSGAFNADIERTASHFVNRLNCWLDLGDVDAALIDGEIATRAAPKYVRGWQRWAQALYLSGDLEKARATFAEAKKLDDTLTEPRMTEQGARAYRHARLARLGDRSALIALVHAAAHDPHDTFAPNASRAAAISILDEQLAREPRNADLLILRAQAEDASNFGIKFGTAETALPWLDRAVEAAPENGRAYLVRGMMRLGVLGSDKPAEAGYADLDRAFSLGAVTPEALAKRSDHRAEQKNFPGAIADLNAALALSPDDDDLTRQRASLHELAGDRPAALADWTRLIERHPDADRDYRRRAETRAAASEWKEALADFDAAIARDADNSGHYLGRAAALRGLGRTAEAKAAHALARQFDSSLPELAPDLGNAAEIEALRNDFSHALKTASASMARLNEANLDVLRAGIEAKRAEDRLRRLLSGDRRKPDEVIEEVTSREEAKLADAEDFRDRARARAGKDDHDGAIADLDRAIELDPQSAESFDLRGRIHEARRNLDGAFADYDKAVALAPTNADYVRDRGDIGWERGNFESALRDYSAAVEHDDTDAINWFKRGNARFKLGRFAEAITDYDKALELKPDFENATKNREVARERLAAK